MSFFLVKAFLSYRNQTQIPPPSTNFAGAPILINNFFLYIHDDILDYFCLFSLPNCELPKRKDCIYCVTNTSFHPACQNQESPVSVGGNCPGHDFQLTNSGSDSMSLYIIQSPNSFFCTLHPSDTASGCLDLIFVFDFPNGL